MSTPAPASLSRMPPRSPVSRGSSGERGTVYLGPVPPVRSVTPITRQLHLASGSRLSRSSRPSVRRPRIRPMPPAGRPGSCACRSRALCDGQYSDGADRRVGMFALVVIFGWPRIASAGRVPPMPFLTARAVSVYVHADRHLVRPLDPGFYGARFASDFGVRAADRPHVVVGGGGSGRGGEVSARRAAVISVLHTSVAGTGKASCRLAQRHILVE